MEVICRDHWLERIVAAIMGTCRTGAIGDGKIFIYPVEEIIRISSGERGDALYTAFRYLSWMSAWTQHINMQNRIQVKGDLAKYWAAGGC